MTSPQETDVHHVSPSTATTTSTVNLHEPLQAGVTISASGYRVYNSRWHMLAMFCALEMANALMWVTFAPISDLAGHYFSPNERANESTPYEGSTTGVNMLANVFLALYVPGTIFAIWAMQVWRPRFALILAGTFTAAGAGIRLLVAYSRDSMSDGMAYALMFLGQAVGALAQPFFLNFPPAIAAMWFPVEERDLSTTIGSMCSPIGNAIGQVIPILFVTESEKDKGDGNTEYTVDGMPTLMLVEFILCCIPLALTVWGFQDSPATPPSASQEKKRDLAATEASAGAMTGDLESTLLQSNFAEVDPYSTIRRDLKILFSNRDYVILFGVFAIGVGFFNSVLTLLNQIVAPHGYSNDDAGIFGAVFILFGIAGAGVIGKLMESTRAYRELLRGGMVLAVFAAIFFMTMLFSNNYWPLLLSFCVMGFAVLPLLPVMMENCAEVTYPVAEEMSMGILFAASNVLGLGFIFALQYLLETDSSDSTPPFLPSNFFIFGILSLAATCLLFYNGQYLRMQHEEQRRVEGSDTSVPVNPLHVQ